MREAYDEQHLVDGKGKGGRAHRAAPAPYLALFQVCRAAPLSKKLGDKAMEIRNELAKDFMVDYDDAGSIGKRYRRQDEIGTPLCITVDFQTVGDDKGRGRRLRDRPRPRHDGADPYADFRAARLCCQKGCVLSKYRIKTARKWNRICRQFFTIFSTVTLLTVTLPSSSVWTATRQ